MRLPWSKPAVEVRASAYTDQVVRALLSAAAGTSAATAAETGALEICCGWWARSLASAAPSAASAAVTPEYLACVGRELCRRGDVVHAIDVDPLTGATALVPVGEWDIQGGPLPASWQYTCTLSGPSTMITRRIPAAGVVHIRMAADPARPWCGLGPLQYAARTGRLMGAIERHTSEEFDTTVGQVIPQQSKPRGELDADFNLISSLEGAVALVTTSNAPSLDGMSGTAARGASDWMPRRLGATVPAGNVALREDVERCILGVCGLGGWVTSESDGTRAREGYREFVSTVVNPIARIVESELSRKLEQPVELEFSKLNAADVAGRARAYGVLLNAGMSDDDASLIVGFD